MDNDPFADLGDAVSGDDQDETEEEPTSTATEPEETSMTDATTTVDDQEPEFDPMTDPAFSYEEAKQRPVYARESTIKTFDDWLRYDVERELSKRGYDNITVREMTDALLRTVPEEDLVDEVAQRFEQARKNTE